MATTNFNVSNAAVTRLGSWFWAYITSQRCHVPAGQNSLLSFTATGTECKLTFAVSSTGVTYFEASIDGGAYADITGPGSTNTYTACTMFTGLSDAAHTVVVRHKSGSTQSNIRVQETNGIEVTGASPAIAIMTGYGPAYHVGNAENLSSFRFEGHVDMSASAGHSRMALILPDARVRFRSDATSIAVFSSVAGGKLRVMQDGVAIGSATSFASSGYGMTVLASGLSGTHDYDIVAVNATATYLVQVMLVGGTLATTPTARPAIMFCGDSKAMGGSGTGDSSVCFPSLVGAAKGYAVINNSYSGVLCLASGGSGAAEWFAPAYFMPYENGQTDIKYVVWCLGHNDNGDDMTEFEASVTRHLTKLQAAYSGAVAVLALGVLQTSTFNSTVRGNLNTAISNAASAVGGNCSYVNTDSWITSGDTSDGTHPTAAGHALISAALQAYIKTYQPPVSPRPTSLIGV